MDERPGARVARGERRIGDTLLEVVGDLGRVADGGPRIIDEGRHLPGRVPLPVAKLRLDDPYLARLVGEALYVQDAADLVAEGRDLKLVEGEHGAPSARRPGTHTGRRKF